MFRLGRWKKPGRKKIVPPYSALAKIYDEVMDHVNYRKWALYLSEIVSVHGQDIHSILDISCGTGTLCQHLESLGYLCCGCDYSAEMVKIARKKERRMLGMAKYWCANMTNPAVRQPAGCIISIYDSMNYLMHKRDWEKCLISVSNILKSKGLFIFDISTISNSKKAFQNYNQQEITLKGRYLRKSYFDEKLSEQINSFEIQLNEDPGTIYYETHRQRILDVDTILLLVKQSSFILKGCYSGFTFMPGSDDADRVHFILGKS